MASAENCDGAPTGWMGDWTCKTPYFSQDCKPQCGVKHNVRSDFTTFLILLIILFLGQAWQQEGHLRDQEALRQRRVQVQQGQMVKTKKASSKKILILRIVTDMTLDLLN